MISQTPNTLKKLQTLLKESGYQIRKGKGSFNTGYCILEAKKVIVLNRYHSIEAQIGALIDIIGTINVNEDLVSTASKKLYQKLDREVYAQKKETEETIDEEDQLDEEE